MAEHDQHYIISGGAEGKERLSTLSEVLAPHTRALLELEGPITGMRMLDLGCGGGHVSLMAARMVGEAGHVTGIDFDSGIIALAEQDAQHDNITNVTFHAQSAYEIGFHEEFDLVYSRFLLSHLERPLQVLQRMRESVKPGGRIIVEDVQFSGHFCYPPHQAFDDYLHYYTAAARQHGQNPEIGPALFGLFHEAGIRDVRFDVIQPCFHTGPGKRMAYITMEKISAQVIRAELTDQPTIDAVLKALDDFTRDERTIISLPRIFRVWGEK